MASSKKPFQDYMKFPVHVKRLSLLGGKQTSINSFDWRKVPNVSFLVFGLCCSHQGIQEDYPKWYVIEYDV